MSSSEATGPERLAGNGGYYPALHFDPAEYQRFVEDNDLTPVQQQELLEALWIIIVGFVDLGFGIHPVQLVLDVGKNHAALEPDSASVIACKKPFSTKAKQDRDANGARSEG